MIYLDNAATTFPKPEVLYEANDYAQRNLAFNAGRGSYKQSKISHQYIEECRSILCEKANAKNLLFSASATSCLNMVVAGLNLEENDIVYHSPYDHNAIVRTLYEKSKIEHFTIKKMSLNEDLSIDLKKLSIDIIRDKPKAIFCTHVSNVTGYILPVGEIGKLTEQIDTKFIVDGAQAFGLINLNLQLSNIDYYVFAGHKTLYGPFGIAGILCKDKQIDLDCVFYGGTGSDSLNVYMPQEGTSRFEPSSPNIVAIYSLLKSSQWIFEQNSLEHEKFLVDYLIKKLSLIDDLIIYIPPNDYTGILSINIKGYKSNEVAKILEDDYSILVRSDYHCSPFIHDHLKTKEFLGTVRISFGAFSTKEDCDVLVDALEEIAYDI
ncbi:MAG: aminotransferase class V-fold PLP-dependent enzyme [Beduini sp.]|uniref:aminotransferase class V-fold PLP-dependent enzyme n=1 Tax=Beduini sp. TaxID=1922300 RepID=UPI0011CC8EC5